MNAPWHVAIVGVGSVGSQVAESLVRHGVPRLTLVDPDRVEPRNLSRSAYLPRDVGRLKVAALADRLVQIADSPLTLLAFAQDVRSLLPGTDVVRADVVVLATDDPVAELGVNESCYRAGIPMVSAKLFARAEAAELVWISPQRHSPCLRCVTAGRDARRNHDLDYGTGRLLAQPALGADITVVVAQAVKTALALLTERACPADDRRTSPLASWLDHLSDAGKVMALTGNVPGWGLFGRLPDGLWGDPWATVWVRASRLPDCLVCGPTAPVEVDALTNPTAHEETPELWRQP